jgi:O-antigen/teichoic acid export membrane protein
LSKKLALNAASNIGDFVASVIITLIMTPLYLSFLGNHDYGIWEMVNSVVGYMGLLDLGFRASITRHISLLNKQKKYEEVNRVFTTGIAYMSLIGLSLFFFFWGWSSYSPETLAENNLDANKYQTFLLLVGCTIFFSFIRQATEGALEGKQLYVMKNIAKLFIKFISAAYLYFNLTAENGIILLIQVTLTASIARVILFNILLWLAQPPINIFTPPSFEMFKTLFKFGSKSLINGIGLALEHASGAFLIGVLLTPAAIPLYVIPLSITRYIVSFIESASSVLMPFFTEISVDNNSEKLASTYILFSKIFIWFLITSVVFVIMFGADFIDIWLSNQFIKSEVNWLIALFSLSIMIEKMSPLGVRLSTALNRHGIFAKLRPISACCVFFLSYLLISQIGITGAIYAKLIILCIFTPIYIKHALSLVSISFNAYFYQCIYKNVITLIILVLFGLTCKYFFIFDSYTSLIIVLFLTALIGGILLLSKTLTPYERGFVLGVLSKKFKRT